MFVSLHESSHVDLPICEELTEEELRRVAAEIRDLGHQPEFDEEHSEILHLANLIEVLASNLRTVLRAAGDLKTLRVCPTIFIEYDDEESPLISASGGVHSH